MCDTVSYILVDLDGVLVDIAHGVCAWHDLPYPYAGHAHRGQYDMARACGMDYEAFWKPGDSPYFWLDLGWMPDGAAILDAAERAVGAEHVYLLTSPTSDAGAYTGKAWWVKDHIPQYYPRLMIGSGKHLCASPKNLLVDDCDQNVDRFIAHAGQAILVPRLWNRRHAEADSALQIVARELGERV